MTAPVPAVFARARELGRPLVLGHRGGAHLGASAYTAENTLESFLAARALGADGIELDVRACASGEVVVFHDADLSRMAGRPERISAMSLTQVREVRLPHGARIPTLGQVLAALDPECIVNIEIKSPGPGRVESLVDRVLECILESGAGSRVIVSSFDPQAVSHLGRRAPEIVTGFLFHAGEPLALERALGMARFRPHAVHPEHTLVTPERMVAWRDRGLAVAGWTADAEPDIRRLAKNGSHAVITNEPERARRALEVLL